MLAADSLIEELLPVDLDEVPGQGFPDDVAGDAADGGGGVLLPDELGVQGVVQVPVRAGSALVITTKGCSQMILQTARLAQEPALPRQLSSILGHPLGMPRAKTPWSCLPLVAGTLRRLCRVTG